VNKATTKYFPNC